MILCMKECSDCFLVVLGVEDCCLVCVIACLRLLVLGNSTGIIFQPKICSNINYQLIMLSLTRHISSHHLNEDVIVLLCIILHNAFFTLFSLLGTMGNLLCVLAHCSGRGEEIITGDKSHIFLLEQGNVAQVSESQCRISKLQRGLKRIFAGCVMRAPTARRGIHATTSKHF